MPENVAWLGQVESTWKPTALSWAAASGLWQFIPGTGSRFGLQRTAYVDERNSFDEATRASARYLKFLANRYHGNWELAMAAYNSGEGNVDRAVRRAGVENFWAGIPVSAAGNAKLRSEYSRDDPDREQSEPIRFWPHSPGSSADLRSHPRSGVDKFEHRWLRRRIRASSICDI